MTIPGVAADPANLVLTYRTTLIRAHAIVVEIYLSEPDLGAITGAGSRRVRRRPSTAMPAKARRNYSGTSPITRASGKKKIVTARCGRLIDALMIQVFGQVAADTGEVTDAPAPEAPRYAPTPTSGSAARSTPASLYNSTQRMLADRAIRLHAYD